MNVEIEGKMRIGDVAAIEARLVTVGAQRCSDLLEFNTYFDSAQGGLKASDQGLRVRVERDLKTGHERVVVTYKGPRHEGLLKKRTETQFEASDAATVTQLFVALGYSPVLTFEKRRRSWRHHDCEVVIDTVPYLGDFIEIEGPSEQAVLAARQALGLGDVPLVDTSYIAMLCDYLDEHGIAADYVRLDDVVGTRS